jgi:GT2 family glycosyltransferase
MEKHAAVLDSVEGPVSPLKALDVPDLTVITISTNEGSLLDPCLASVFKSDVRFECIVFNNASSDGTASLLREKFADPRLRVVTNPSKKGFIENNNDGFRLARGRYVLLLNPDTVVQPDTFKKMIDFMDTHPRAAVATCQLRNLDGTRQHNVRRFPTPLTYFYRILQLDKAFPHHRTVGKYLLSDMQWSETQPTDWFITAFFFMRKSVIDAIGPFDQSLLQPFYCEDLEWCYRSRINGYKNYYVADTSILHHYQQTSRRKIGRLTAVHLFNILVFFRKHGWSMLLGREKRR